MIRSSLASAAVLLLSVPLVSDAPSIARESFLPPNELQISMESIDAKGITRAQFDEVMDRLQSFYGPVVAARGGTLVINRLWEDPTVNASAEREGSDYIINMYGGLARHEAITQDGMALVACHELGHLIGGAPKYGSDMWASNEGQADYFANLKCLRRIFSSPSAQSFTRALSEDPGPREACGKSHAAAADQAICVRTSMAGMSVTSLFKIAGHETVSPRFDTPDPTIVTRTNDGHPATQCRLDTFFAGSLCARPVGDALDETDPAPGTCTLSAGYTVGLRPLCWYKPPMGESPNSQTGIVAAPPPTPQRHPRESSVLTALAQGNPWQGL